MNKQHTLGAVVLMGALGITGAVAIYNSRGSDIQQISKAKVEEKGDFDSNLENRVKILEDRLRLPDSAVDSIDLRQEFSVYAQNLGMLSRENVEQNEKINGLTTRVDELFKVYGEINKKLAERYDIKPLTEDEVSIYLDGLSVSHSNAPRLVEFYSSSKPENRAAFEKEVNRYLGLAIATGNEKAYKESMLWAIKQFKEDGKTIDAMPEDTEEQKMAKRLAQLEKSNAFQSDFLKAAVGVDLTPKKRLEPSKKD